LRNLTNARVGVERQCHARTDNQVYTTLKMPAPTRKACANCVKSKRKCDLDSPICGRCLQRNLRCDYSDVDRASIHRPGRPSSAHASEHQEHITFILQDGTTTSTGSSTTPSATMDTSPHRLASDLTTSPPTSVDSTTAAAAAAAAALYQPDELGMIGEPETCEHLLLDDDLIVGGGFCHARIEFAQRALQGWLATLAARGANAFVTMRLYEEHDMPSMDAAFAAVAAYVARTPATAPLVKRLVRRNVAALKQDVAAAAETLSPVQRLAATQAMLLYQVIRLFDGDIRLRTDGEADEALVFEWTEALRAQVRSVREPWERHAPSGIPARETIERLNVWIGWLVDESVRRTVLTAYALLGTYTALKYGYQRTWGRMRNMGFTAQKALWEAGSAFAWWKLNADKKPLKAQVGTWDADMEDAEPSDIEEMGLLFLVSIKGQDYASRWLGSVHMERLGVDWSESTPLYWRDKP
jgi:hypothetical protein